LPKDGVPEQLGIVIQADKDILAGLHNRLGGFACLSICFHIINLFLFPIL
jgi:hypothetical protein